MGSAAGGSGATVVCGKAVPYGGLLGIVLPVRGTEAEGGSVTMKVTAWSNGSPARTGAGYGLRISTADRDRFFKRSWSQVVVDLPDGTSAVINLSDSFWRGCSELRSAAVGRWLLHARLAPWPRGAPPSLTLTLLEDDRFALQSPGR
jgi:hypothetical protein